MRDTIELVLTLGIVALAVTMVGIAVVALFTTPRGGHHRDKF